MYQNIKKNKNTSKGFRLFNLKNRPFSLAAVALLVFLLPGKVFAGWTLEVGIPFLGKSNVTLSQYVSAVYNFAAMAVGIVGVLMFLVGGFQYMISAGNRGMAGEARKTMINAIIGIVLVLAAFVFLRTINRELTQFEGLNFQ